jgi:hypothetical protein
VQEAFHGHKLVERSRDHSPDRRDINHHVNRVSGRTGQIGALQQVKLPYPPGDP